MDPTFRYCPRCGAPISEGLAFGRVRHFCRYCGFVHFRDPKMAVAGLISDGERVLLVRRAVDPRKGFWALPAGYVDYGEMPEGALVREIAEETGLVVQPLGLVGVFPLAGWDEKRGVLLVYRTAVATGQIVAGDDVSDARWYAAAELPWQEIAFESTADLLRQWLADGGPGAPGAR